MGGCMCPVRPAAIVTMVTAAKASTTISAKTSAVAAATSAAAVTSAVSR